jgi:hypothetical protein
MTVGEICTSSSHHSEPQKKTAQRQSIHLETQSMTNLSSTKIPLFSEENEGNAHVSYDEDVTFESWKKFLESDPDNWRNMCPVSIYMWSWVTYDSDDDESDSESDGTEKQGETDHTERRDEHEIGKDAEGEQPRAKDAQDEKPRAKGAEDENTFGSLPPTNDLRYLSGHDLDQSGEVFLVCRNMNSSSCSALYTIKIHVTRRDEPDVRSFIQTRLAYIGIQ